MMAASPEVRMPRGFLGDFARGMEHFGLNVELVEGRHWKKPAPGGHHAQRGSVPLAARADRDVTRVGAGDHQVACGQRKTVMILAAIARLSCKALVIVNTKDILWQWQERAEEVLGEDFPVGQIGDNKFEVSQYLTIATAQTLHSRFDELEARASSTPSRSSAWTSATTRLLSTYNKILNRFSSRYRVGVSATPDKTGDFALAQHVLGTVIHTTKPEGHEPHQAQGRARAYQVRLRLQRSQEPLAALELPADDRSDHQPIPERNKLIVDRIVENRTPTACRHEAAWSTSTCWARCSTTQACKDTRVTLVGKDSNDHRKMVAQMAEEDRS
jgi:hypothetical protein